MDETLFWSKLYTGGTHLDHKSGVSRTSGEEVLVLAVTMETVIVVMVIVVTLNY